MAGSVGVVRVRERERVSVRARERERERRWVYGSGLRVFRV